MMNLMLTFTKRLLRVLLGVSCAHSSLFCGIINITLRLLEQREEAHTALGQATEKETEGGAEIKKNKMVNTDKC